MEFSTLNHTLSLVSTIDGVTATNREFGFSSINIREASDHIQTDMDCDESEEDVDSYYSALSSEEDSAVTDESESSEDESEQEPSFAFSLTINWGKNICTYSEGDVHVVDTAYHGEFFVHGGEFVAPACGGLLFPTDSGFPQILYGFASAEGTYSLEEYGKGVWLPRPTYFPLIGGVIDIAMVTECWNSVPLRLRPGHFLFSKMMPAFHSSETTDRTEIAHEFELVSDMLCGARPGLYFHGSKIGTASQVGELLWTVAAWYFSGIDIAFYFSNSRTKSARPFGLPAGAKPLGKCNVCKELTWNQQTKICGNDRCKRNKKQIVKCNYCGVKMTATILEGKTLYICDEELCDSMPHFCDCGKRKNIYRGAWSCYDCSKKPKEDTKKEEPIRDAFMDIFDNPVHGPDLPPQPAIVAPPVLPVEPVLVEIVAIDAVEGPVAAAGPVAPVNPHDIEHPPPPLPPTNKNKKERPGARGKLNRVIKADLPKIIEYNPQEISVLEIKWVYSDVKLISCLALFVLGLFVLSSAVHFSFLIYLTLTMCLLSKLNTTRNFILKFFISWFIRYLCKLFCGSLLSFNFEIMDNLMFLSSSTLLIFICIRICFMEVYFKTRVVKTRVAYVRKYLKTDPVDGRVDAVKIGEPEYDADLAYFKVYTPEVKRTNHILKFFWGICSNFPIFRVWYNSVSSFMQEIYIVLPVYSATLSSFGHSVVSDKVVITETEKLCSIAAFAQLISIDKVNSESSAVTQREIMLRFISKSTKLNLNKNVNSTEGTSVADNTIFLALAWSRQLREARPADMDFLLAA